MQLTAQEYVSESLHSFSINASTLNTNKTIWVYLPKNYTKSKAKYPVIYMHDAQNLFDAKASYAGEWKVDDYMDGLGIGESIVVGIEHGNDKRIDELTPFKHDKYGGGQGEAYLDFIINIVKPKIEADYRVKTNPSDTTIMGSSLGGLLSFYAILKYPEEFGNAGVFSPSFWINPEIFDLVENTDIPSSSKFYIMVGGKEGESMVEDFEKMVELLKSKGLSASNLTSEIIQDGEHNEKLWASQFPKAYQWFNSSN
ncbi:alpha/beta hydrolase [Winogradskyella maritima]|uniref:Alpha/beta hydrolase n=1 Tax=Winogradskyella maritima TaxID=1517766 RepID=A0ABV8AJT9_9FLAO